jgi:hypothetical protein
MIFDKQLAALRSYRIILVPLIRRSQNVLAWTQKVHPVMGHSEKGAKYVSSIAYGPLEMGVAYLFVGPPGALAVGLFFGSDQPGIGAKTLHRAKALDVGK